MNVKGHLKKVFTVVLWCLLGGSGLALLLAAINAKNSSLCQGVEFEINGGGKPMFLDKKELSVMLESDGLRNFRKRKATSVDLLKMEKLLRTNSWVRDVQMYFDNNQILKIRIQERQPVARLFTISGIDYLIDSNGVQLAVPEKTVFSLPVFTGYPEERFGSRRDSVLDREIRSLAIFLNQDPFWSCQIQEIHIAASKTFYMTPLIGNQVIEFGDGTDLENKFHRLFVFYKSVIIHTGFEKYTGISLAFANQVIATRKQGFITRADSIQARKNVIEMIRLAQKMESDTLKIREVKPLEKNTLTEQNLRSYDLPEENENKNETSHKH
jgi:cell division protein FtsQ